MDVTKHNREAWDANVEQGDPWTLPVGAEAIARARRGDWAMVLTPSRPVPRDWFPPLKGTPTLCLASGGGQQAPLLAAAGATVTVVDNSPRQLAQDRFVAHRDQLELELIEGDMADLSMFSDEVFELIVHPCSNCFAPEVRPVWKECHRVLRPGGMLLAGFANPLRYLFDDERMENGSLEVRHELPYSDLTSLSDLQRQRIIIDRKRPLEFGHTLDDQIGGQLDAGFAITGFYEDKFDDLELDPISKYIPSFIATRAVKE